MKKDYSKRGSRVSVNIAPPTDKDPMTPVGAGQTSNTEPMIAVEKAVKTKTARQHARNKK